MPEITVKKVPPYSGKSKAWRWGVHYNGVQVAEVKTRKHANRIVEYINNNPDIDYNRICDMEDRVK